MRKFYILLIAAVCMTTLSSCMTSEAATIGVAVETEYYDYMNNVVVIYIDGIANYRYWDPFYSRYYYRPVPRERFGYIRPRHHHVAPRPVPPCSHHDVRPGHTSRPSVTPRQHDNRPNIQPGRTPSNRPNVTPRQNPGNRPATPHHNGNSRFGGRR